MFFVGGWSGGIYIELCQMLHLFHKKSRNNGAFADFLDKRNGKGKGNLVMKSTPSRVGWSRPDVVLVALWPGSRSMCAF